MKLLIRNYTDFGETKIILYSNNDEILLTRTVSDPVQQYISELPDNFRVEKVEDVLGYEDSYMIYENH